MSGESDFAQRVRLEALRLAVAAVQVAREAPRDVEHLVGVLLERRGGVRLAPAAIAPGTDDFPESPDEDDTD